MIASRKVASPAAVSPIQNGFSLISNEKLLQLYATMLKCRLVEQRLRGLAKKNKLEKPADIPGQEAAIVGITIDLLPGDTLAPSHGALVPCFAKGLPLRSVLASLFPRPAGSRSPFGVRHLLSPALSNAAQINKIVSVAIANKTRKNGKIAVAFCGDLSTSPSLLHQSMKLAAARKLPILFVGHSGHDADAASHNGIAPSLPIATVDSNDVVAVYRVATEAVTHARRGSGPTLLECKPWCLPSQPLQTEDPLLNMEKYLTRKGLFTSKLYSETTTGFKRELNAATKLIPGR